MKLKLLVVYAFAALFIRPVTIEVTDKDDKGKAMIRDESLSSICFGGDKCLVTGNKSGFLDLWDIGSRKRVAHEQVAKLPITLLQSVGSNKYVSFIVGGSEIDTFELDSKRCRQIVIYDSNPIEYRLTSDCKQCVSIHRDGSLRLYDIVAGKETATVHPLFISPNASLGSLSLSCDNKLVAVTVNGGALKKDPQVVVYQLPMLVRMSDYSVSAQSAASVEFHTTEPEILAMPAGQKAVRLINVYDGDAESKTIELPERLLRLKFAPSGNALVVSCLEGCVTVIRKGMPRDLVQFSDPPYMMRALSVNPGNNLLALLVCDKTPEVFLYDLENMKPYNGAGK